MLHLSILISSTSLLFPFTSSFLISALLFLLHLRIPLYYSSLLVDLLHCGMLALRFELEVLLFARLVWVFFHKTGFFRRLICTFLSFVSGLFISVQFSNFRCTLLPYLLFYYFIYQKIFFM